MGRQLSTRPGAGQTTILLRRGARSGQVEVVDLDGSDGARGFESEHGAVEIQLRFEAANDRVGLAEPVLLAFECDVGDRQSLRADGVRHSLGLIRRDHPVLESLEQDQRARQAVDEMDG